MNRLTYSSTDDRGERTCWKRLDDEFNKSHTSPEVVSEVGNLYRMWVKNTYNGDMHIHYYHTQKYWYIDFENEEDAMFFKLRFEQ